MGENKGFILSLAEGEQGLKVEGHYGMQSYGFLRPIVAPTDPNAPPPSILRETSKHIMLTLNTIEPGGGIEEHFHEYNAEMPIFDHVYYVISGRIRATIGDIEKTVGACSIIYCPSNVRHSITNVGKGFAKILRITGSAEGEQMSEPTYIKKKV
jgi:quercetin dioxygenase-like cupin family protein